MNKISSYKDLEVWKLGVDQCVAVYELTKFFPNDEKFGLVSQIRRAAISIPANIAEGYARRHLKEKAHFVSIALGSNAELETHLLVAKRLGYLDDKSLQKTIVINEHVGRSLTKFYKCFEK